MKVKKIIKKDIYGVKIILEDKGKTIGRAFLYIMKNGLHKRPFGYLEDVFVEEEYRRQGFGAKLTKLAILEAKKRKCYKLIATSRTSRRKLHKFYHRWGFKDWGVELRINFK